MLAFDCFLQCFHFCLPVFSPPKAEGMMMWTAEPEESKAAPSFETSGSGFAQLVLISISPIFHLIWFIRIDPLWLTFHAADLFRLFFQAGNVVEQSKRVLAAHPRASPSFQGWHDSGDILDLILADRCQWTHHAVGRNPAPPWMVEIL